MTTLPLSRAAALPSRYYFDPALLEREKRENGVYHFQNLVREFLGET